MKRNYSNQYSGYMISSRRGSADFFVKGLVSEAKLSTDHGNVLTFHGFDREQREKVFCIRTL